MHVHFGGVPHVPDGVFGTCLAAEVLACLTCLRPVVPLRVSGFGEERIQSARRRIGSGERRFFGTDNLAIALVSRLGETSSPCGHNGPEHVGRGRKRPTVLHPGQRRSDSRCSDPLLIA